MWFKKVKKYHNKPVEIGGEKKFDSQGEYLRWVVLKAKQDRGEITNLRRQVQFELLPRQPLLEPRINKKGRTERVEAAVSYYADFVYEQDGKTVVEDVKSEATRTSTYVIKRKLMLLLHKIQVKEIDVNG